MRAWRELPDWSRWLAVGGVAYTLVQGQLNGFSGGSGFYGYRLTLELLVCVFPAYALSVPRPGRGLRRLLGPVLGLQFAAISLGAAGDGGHARTSTTLWTDNSFVYAVRMFPALDRLADPHDARRGPGRIHNPAASGGPRGDVAGS